jgi:hypothetical protein
MDWDPFNLRPYGAPVHKKMMTLLFACLISLTLALVVFIVASMSRDEVTENSLNVRET